MDAPMDTRADASPVPAADRPRPPHRSAGPDAPPIPDVPPIPDQAPAPHDAPGADDPGRPLHADGQWLSTSGATRFPLVSPADGRDAGALPLAGPADIDRAVASARRALRDPRWAGLDPVARAVLLEAFAAELEKNAPERAALTSVQNGMPISTAVPAEGYAPAAILRYHAALARNTPLEERRPRADGAGHSHVRRLPAGVVAVVAPWNFPQPITMFKLAPALAAGCTVVLKPSPYTFLGARAIVAAAERAGLPPGVLNLLPGDDATGAALVRHPGVDKVSFTGSTAAGRKVAAACAELLRPVVLELSSRSAAIVLDDADADETAAGLAAGALLHSGQACYMSTRILVPRERSDEITARIAAMADALPIGDPLDPATRLGPLLSAVRRDRVRSAVASALADGARLATSRRAGDVPDEGYYAEPAVLAGLDHSHPAVREEIFGPVLCVVPYDGVDHAVALANDSPYGLGGTIWTSDVERALAVSRRVETGTVGVNFFDLDLGAPYGGIKASGLGRELGPEGFDAYFRFQTVYTRS